MESNSGARVTSRIEGAHAELKRYLQVSTGHLLDVVEAIDLWIKNMYENQSEALATVKQRVPYRVRKENDSRIIGLASHTSLTHIQNQIELAQAHDYDKGVLCTKLFRSCMGLPCGHDLRSRLQQKYFHISINEINQHWWFNRVDTPLTNVEASGLGHCLFEPLVLTNKRGRLKKPNEPLSSTTQNLSFWELAPIPPLRRKSIDGSNDNRQSQFASATTPTDTSSSYRQSDTSDVFDRPKKRQKKFAGDISTDTHTLSGQKIHMQTSTRERRKTKETYSDRLTDRDLTMSVTTHHLTVKEARIAALVAASIRAYESSQVEEAP